jgi:hypothetical protein
MRGARLWLVVGLLAGAIVRIWLLPNPGTPDVGSWKIWAAVGASDPTSLYGVGGSPPERRLISWNGMSGTTEYPPVALYQMGLAGAAYRQINPALADSTAFTVLIKVPGLLAEVAFLIAIFLWRQRLGGAAAWIALAYWLNPAIIINGAALGYLDAQMASPAALALIAASAGGFALTGGLAALALLTKAQALFTIPALGVALLGARSASWPRRLADLTSGAVLVALLAVGPIVVRGAWANMLQAIGRLGAHDMVSGYGLNFWWIVTWLIRATYALGDLDWTTAFTMPVRILAISRMVEVGYPNPKPIGAAIVVAVIAWGAWRARRRPALGVAAAFGAWSILAYAMFSAQVHENHAYAAVPLLAIAAGQEPRLRKIFWWTSAMTALNMYLFYGLGDGRPTVVNRAWTGVDLSVVLSAVNLALFAWFTRQFVALTRPESRP